MKSLLAILSLLTLSLLSARAQDAFFHRGAQHFLTGSNELAKAEVARGLQLHPDNESLKKFWELLNQQSQQQEQQEKQDKQDQQKDQKPQEQQSKDQQDKSKEDQNKDRDQQQQQQQEQKPSEEQNQQQGANQDQGDQKKEEQQGSQQKTGDQEGSPDGQPQGQASIRMTPQQAVRLLETMKAEEQTLQFRPILKTNRNPRLLKDW